MESPIQQVADQIRGALIEVLAGNHHTPNEKQILAAINASIRNLPLPMQAIAIVRDPSDPDEPERIRRERWGVTLQVTIPPWMIGDAAMEIAKT